MVRDWQKEFLEINQNQPFFINQIKLLKIDDPESTSPIREHPEELS
jgi:hypothetical protein